MKVKKLENCTPSNQNVKKLKGRERLDDKAGNCFYDKNFIPILVHPHVIFIGNTPNRNGKRRDPIAILRQIPFENIIFFAEIGIPALVRVP